jgi:predicted DNA-binding transcriptional regulator AlpA
MCGSRSRFLGGDNMSGSGREILQRITGIRPPIPDRLLRAEQARALLGISKSHFYLLVRRGEVPRGTKAFGDWRWRESEIRCLAMHPSFQGVQAPDES